MSGGLAFASSSAIFLTSAKQCGRRSSQTLLKAIASAVAHLSLSGVRALRGNAEYRSRRVCTASMDPKNRSSLASLDRIPKTAHMMPRMAITAAKRLPHMASAMAMPNRTLITLNRTAVNWPGVSYQERSRRNMQVIMSFIPVAW